MLGSSSFLCLCTHTKHISSILLNSCLSSLQEFNKDDTADMYLQERMQAQQQAETERNAAVPGLKYIAPKRQTNSEEEQKAEDPDL